jgi:hypothetical protein
MQELSIYAQSLSCFKSKYLTIVCFGTVNSLLGAGDKGRLLRWTKKRIPEAHEETLVSLRCIHGKTLSPRVDHCRNRSAPCNDVCERSQRVRFADKAETRHALIAFISFAAQRDLMHCREFQRTWHFVYPMCECVSPASDTKGKRSESLIEKLPDRVSDSDHQIWSKSLRVMSG